MEKLKAVLELELSERKCERQSEEIQAALLSLPTSCVSEKESNQKVALYF